jgi:hypothetical protein
MKSTLCTTGATYCKIVKKTMKNTSGTHKGENLQPIEKRDKSTTYTIFRPVLDLYPQHTF